MEVSFADDDLDRLETDASFTCGLSSALVRAYRLRMQAIRAATDERDLRRMKSFHFEKLAGSRQHQYSMRLNDQYRLILEFQGADRSKVVWIIGIEDYH
ncbi:MAG: type II toxin-antitoxin system RelE/ParE family toxin [Chloroflexota bacterium]